ncbi:MAG: type VI secretion system lipoprotein TssJ [Candidatus Manganitrophaceae bacterium]
MALSGLAACGKKEIRLSLTGTASLNAADDGAPLPVVVRVYQLKGKERMEGADFVSLWKEEGKILEEELLERQEVTLFPGVRTMVPLQPKEEAAYLGIMALFRRPEGEGWRQVIPLKESKVRSVEIIVGERTVKVGKVE